MTHMYLAHPIQALHLDHIHWEGWLALVASAALVAFLIAAVANGVDIAALMVDPNLAA